MSIVIEKGQIANGRSPSGMIAKRDVWSVSKNGVVMNALRWGSEEVGRKSIYNGIYMVSEADAQAFADELSDRWPE